MYEKYNGTSRLINALQGVSKGYEMNRLADILHYYPEQLKEDIQALKDYHDEAEEKREENESY